MLKKIILVLALMFASFTALADPCCDKTGVTVGVIDTPTAVAGAQTGPATSTINYSPINETTNKMPVASAATPVLASSNDTCMGSTSGGVSTVYIGVSLGTTWTDNNCVMLKNSRELWNMGLHNPAVARLCMDDLNRDALEVTGIKCPDFEAFREQRKANKASSASAQ